MADEFMKGFGLFSVASFLWLISASWYRTPSFESNRQLIAPPPAEPGTMFDSLGIFLGDLMFWTALVGAFTFWILIPASRQARSALVVDE